MTMQFDTNKFTCNAFFLSKMSFYFFNANNLFFAESQNLGSCFVTIFNVIAVI